MVEIHSIWQMSIVTSKNPRGNIFWENGKFTNLFYKRIWNKLGDSKIRSPFHKSKGVCNEEICHKSQQVSGMGIVFVWSLETGI